MATTFSPLFQQNAIAMEQQRNPKIVFGTMTFGQGDGGRVSDRQMMLDILKVFHSYGFKELDTARMYCDGNTEEVLAELQVEKNGFQIATKAFPFQKGDHSAQKLRSQFLESLKALKTDKVDLFYLHAPDYGVLFEETLGAVDNLYKEGRFARFGLSNYSSWQVMEIYKICQAKGYILPTVYQGRYSVLTRDIEAELYPCLSKLGIDFYAYNPLCGGFLAGNLQVTSEPEGRFHPETIQGKRYRERYWKEQYFEAVNAYKAACQEHNISTVEVALRWLSHHSILSSKDAIIIGASSLKHAEDNMEYLVNRGPLPESLLETLQRCWNMVQPVCPSYFR